MSLFLCLLVARNYVLKLRHKLQVTKYESILFIIRKPISFFRYLSCKTYKRLKYITLVKWIIIWKFRQLRLIDTMLSHLSTWTSKHWMILFWSVSPGWVAGSPVAGQCTCFQICRGVNSFSQPLTVSPSVTILEIWLNFCL